MTPMSLRKIFGALQLGFDCAAEAVKLAKGGKGSGDFGHAGRSGKRGGSVSEGAGSYTNAATGQKGKIKRLKDPTGTLTPEAHGWLTSYITGILGVDANLVRNPLPSHRVIRELAQYVPQKPQKLYRQGATGQPNKQIESWSHDKEFVSEVAADMGTKVTSKVWAPESIVVDTSLIPEKWNRQHNIGYREVIVARGPFASLLALARKP